MPRYIDAEALKKDLTRFYDNEVTAKELIDEQPTADVQPRKHGRWIKHRIDDPKSILHGAVKDTTCSVCGKSTPYNTEYCMHCGARMDGDGDE
jgi:hypothetical protein